MTREGTAGVWSVTVDAVLNGRYTHIPRNPEVNETTEKRRRTSPETSLSPTRDLRAWARTTGYRTFERRAKRPPSVTSQHRKKMSVNVGQEVSVR
ncbi:hypothetical protein NP493_364g01031 [Ridgeia piscesae]|uniref:Uncharacterized protein n=1 Tax=Ridgeia piscesae TaxID=27915 RepID=A0AAD9L337_RIDPI|nr:hypothetical protein NP493_364g01031 [Ridgeia piscesae]